MTSEPFKVATETIDRVAVLTMCGGRGNAFTAAGLAVLEDTLQAAMTQTDIVAVVLTGQGKAFSVGADLAAGAGALRNLIDSDGGERPEWLEPAGRITALMRSGTVPVVAAVNGDAVGGGATLTLGADIRVAATTARFGFGFGKIGVIPEGGSTWMLPKLVGLGRATEWMLSGRVIAAYEALQSGLINTIVENDELIERSVDLARAIGLGTSPRARVEILRLLEGSNTQTFDETRRLESDVMRSVAASPDADEGMAAFLERRAPSFARIGKS
jgi:enoyl-CoA hydratase/carnithine racemase